MIVNKKKYTLEEIDRLLQTQVRFWRYDNREDVYVNKWTISNHGSFGFFPQGSNKPEYDTKEEAIKAFKEHLISKYT